MQAYFTTGSIRIGKCVYTIIMEVIKDGIFIHHAEINGAITNESSVLLQHFRGEYRTFRDLLKKVKEISGKDVSKY